ncbi:MAG: cation:proton antiporter [Candidatus Woesearchaeota archaeon]
MEQELITLGILFGFALVGGVLAARFKQPMLMGLLLVGALIGPHAFGLMKDQHMLESMIEFGAILMLFVLGLEFDIPKLKKIGLKAILIAFLNSAILTFVGFAVATFLGFSVTAALFMGVILAFGSTVVIVKVLENKGLMERQEVPLLIAILIIEDIIAVMVITFFSGMQDTTKGLIGNIESLIISMCILAIVYLVFVKFAKPVLERIIKKNNSEEIITFTALAMCAGFAYLAYHLHLSPAVGAFLAGSIVASLPNSKGFEHAIAPYNIIISSFFFIAIGTLIDFSAIIQHIMVILVFVLVVIVIKLTAFSGMVYFFANMKGDKMFFSSIAMFSVGEFSLLVAKESLNFNIGIDLVSISAAIIAISAILMSLTINYSDKIYQPTVEKLPWKTRKGIEKFANYIKTVSEELDLDNKYTQSLKSRISKSLIILMLIMLTIFGYRKLSMLVEFTPTISTTAYVVVAIITGALMFYLIMTLRKVLTSLAEIFDNATNTRSVQQSRIIVRRIFIGTIILFIALLWPFAMFLVNMNQWYLTVSFVLIALSAWQFHKISMATHDNIDAYKNTFPKYHTFTTSAKFDSSNKTISSKSFNKGWKF